MTDFINSIPADDQHDLLALHGFGESFAGVWVESADLDEIAEFLQLDRQSSRETTLERLEMSTLDGILPLAGEDSVWIGPHSPGWTVIVSLEALREGGPQLCEGGRRMLEVSWMWEIDGVYPLNYRYNGREVSEELEGWVVPEGSALESYAHGLFPLSEGADVDKVSANAYLAIMGRMTGRFLDEDWFRTAGRTYPLSAP